MREYFAKLFSFNQWANDQVVAFLCEQQISDEKIIRIISHILLAQENWYNRASRRQQDLPVWTVLPLAEINPPIRYSDQLWNKLAEGLNEDNFKEILTYKNLAEEPNSNTFQDVLAHVINYATYHRGQIIHLIREAGIAPPSTDYIKFAQM